MSLSQTKTVLESLPHLTERVDFETPNISKKLVLAHRYLGELKGECAFERSREILISTLILLESLQNSAVENIYSTYDAVLGPRPNSRKEGIRSQEVKNCIEALKMGHSELENTGCINLASLLCIQRFLLPGNAGFRRKPGTEIVDMATQEVIYRPPEPEDVEPLMEKWSDFVNDNSKCRLDPLIKMALIHHQFESIHPFYDGNGRTGRIINILYLMHQGLLDLPGLYMSRYIYQNRPEYYQLLQSAREHDLWEEWVIYMLDTVHLAAQNTLLQVKKIKSLFLSMKRSIREACPKIYSPNLICNLFEHPYTKVAFLKNDIKKTRPTATRYLDTLAEVGFLEKQRLGKENYYINIRLLQLLEDISISGRDHFGEGNE